MLRRVLALLGGVVAILAIAADAHAERRVALVVGNAHYEYAGTLRNPVNDATAIAGVLKTLGFEVVMGADLDQQAFANRIEQFGRMLEGADVGLFFYAGHGLQMNGKNYLISTQAKLENEFLIPAETVELDAIVALMESHSRINLVFLDACRNNPLADKLRQNLAAEHRSVSLGRGLARIEAGRDTLIAFAAAPGQEAADGRDRHSPFTSALLRQMPKPGVEVSVMLKKVAAEVRQETDNAQRPQQLSDMSETFYFAKSTPAVAASPEPPKAVPAAPDNSIEVAYWNSARSANDCDSVRAYLTRFPNGNFADLARLSERRLCDSAGGATAVATNRPAVTRQPTVSAEQAQTPAPAATSSEPPRLVVTAAPPAASPPVENAAENPPPPAAPPTASPPIENAFANLPQQATPGSEPAGQADSSPVQADLARDLQRELARVGCVTGRPDGVWGARSRDAVKEFNRYARADVDADAPSQDALAAVQQHHGRVCPAEARSPRVKQETAQPRRSRKAAAHRDRHELVQPRGQQQLMSPRLQQEEAQSFGHTKPAPGQGTLVRDWQSISPLCQSAYSVGGRQCCTYDPPNSAPRIICR